MILSPNADQELIISSAREVLTSMLPISRVRELHSAYEAIDAPTWSRCVELGWLGLSIPEDDGGVGLGFVEETLLHRELGRALAPGPFHATSLAASLASRTGEAELAADFATGHRTAHLAVGEFILDHVPGGLALAVDGEAVTLTAVSDVAPVPATDPGVRLASFQTGDTVLRVAEATTMDRLRVLCGAQLLGALEALRDQSASYAVTREQFGRPIGTFQAVKHRCADMAINAYATRAQVFAAAVLVDAGHPDAAFHAAAANRVALHAARAAAADAIQNLGGVGFTWEYDAHLYLKRIETLDHASGGRDSAHRAIMQPGRHEFR